jgi:hypothetical protein
MYHVVTQVKALRCSALPHADRVGPDDGEGTPDAVIAGIPCHALKIDAERGPRPELPPRFRGRTHGLRAPVAMDADPSRIAR